MRAQSRSGWAGGLPTVMWMPLTSKVEKNAISPCSKAAGICVGVALQKQAGEFAVDLRRHGALLAEHDGVAVAALGDGRGGGPALGVLEDEDAHRQGRLQIVLADDLAERVAELLEADHGLAAGAWGRRRSGLRRAAGELHPMVVRREEAREVRRKSSRRILFLLSRDRGA